MKETQVAIEIGFDKVRASACIGRDVFNVPIGPMPSPYSFPPIGVKTQSGYKFGEVAKLCAVTAPESTVFLSDYLSQNVIPRDAFISFLNVLKERITELYNLDIESIALILPPYFKDLVQLRFLEGCITSISKNIPVRNSHISFSRSFLNVNVGQRIVFLDFRDNPSSISIISRGSRAYDSLGSIKIDDFSLIDCENYIEDKILSNYATELFPDGEITTAWIQGDIASKISQEAINQLMFEKNVKYEIPFTIGDLTITQSEFQDWLFSKIDKVCERILEIMRELGMNLSEISQIVMLGSVFQGRLIRERIEKFLNGYNQSMRYAYFSLPMDEWKVCQSVLINNFNNRFALEL